MTSYAGIGLKILSTFLFAIMIALIKYLSTNVPTGEIVFARCLFALIPLFVIAFWQGNLKACIKTERPWLHVRRSVVGLAAMSCWFLALKYLPLPEATAISFSVPLMVVALAALVLKETVRLYRWSAVGVGLVGVTIIIAPRLAHSAGDVELLGILFACISTVLMALAAILVRHMTKSERNEAIIFYFFFTASVLSAVSIFWGWVWPDGQTMALLVLAGLFGGLGQITMTQAFRLTEASLLAPFDYINMVWALLIGALLFDELPNLSVLAGGAIVVGAGLFVVFRERQLGLERKGEARLRDM